MSELRRSPCPVGGAAVCEDARRWGGGESVGIDPQTGLDESVGGGSWLGRRAA